LTQQEIGEELSANIESGKTLTADLEIKSRELKASETENTMFKAA
jgi:hypothetical protein